MIQASQAFIEVGRSATCNYIPENFKFHFLTISFKYYLDNKKPIYFIFNNKSNIL